MSTMTARTRIAAVVVAAAASLGSATADAATVNGRQHHQHARIARGLATGQLTPREAARLNRGAARIATLEARMRTNRNGALSPRERRVLGRELDRLSRAIGYETRDRQHR